MLLQKEMVSFLTESRHQLMEINKQEYDEFHHFGSSVASQLRNKPPIIAKQLMREIAGLVLAEIIVGEEEKEN